MKLNQLRDFLAVAESGSIHQAARTLNVSQPALTKSIRQLEKDLGAPLFERSTKGAVLNPLGYTFLARVRLVANELERARDEVGQLLGRGGGRVSLATSGTPSMLFLPSALKQFRRRFPDAQIRIVDGLLPVMLPELRDGQIDFAMAPKPAQSLGKGYLVTPNLSMNSPAFLERMKSLAVTRINGPSAEFADFLQRDRANWGQVVKAAGTKLTD